MSSTVTERSWAQFVQIRSRYQRSVHLQRDAKGPDWLSGYVVTPLGRSILSRMGHGLREDGTARSWSITGPYGSGKSAFALFLSQLLATEDLGAAKAARSLLGKADKPLRTALFGSKGVLPGNADGLCPVLATGERRPLESILLDALVDAAHTFWSNGNRPLLVEELIDTANRAGDGDLPTAGEVVSLFERTAAQVRSSKKAGRGLLVILDEAGKTLEEIVTSGSKADIHLLQELAEAANRSGDTPIVLVVLLHQAFENYAARLSASNRNEWMKVQGRFEDVPFQEPADQVLRLIGAAIQTGPLPKDLADRARMAAKKVASICNPQLSERSEDLEENLFRTAPLHPSTALALGPLFRSRLAQNERSLFAFLGSAEPKGFQEFLANALINGTIPLFSLDNLYDYVIATYGGRLYSNQSRVWAQMDTALHRLPADTKPVDVRIIKAVGLLGLLGEAAGLNASLRVIHASVWFGNEATGKTREALERLQRASILIFRKFKNAYALWDGSDLDLDDLIEKARVDTTPYANLATRLVRIAPPRPLVARRHFHETGTFRYFEVRYADERLVLEDCEFVPEDCGADGVLWIVLPTSESAEAGVHRALQQPATWNVRPNPLPVLVGLPARRSQLIHLLDDLSAIEAVEATTPELQSDPVARRELTGRRDETLALLRQELQEIMTTGGNARWYAKQHVHARGIETSSLTQTLSGMCESAYNEAPVIKNELLNRRQLSSAASAARRVLMVAMVENAAKERLGFTGHPPELSMYRSMLEVHGMHKQEDDVWKLAPPAKSKRGSLRPAWDALDSLLASQGDAKVTLSTIYTKLGAPPYGLKLGILPVLVLAYALVHEAHIGTFEDGSFYPVIDAPFIERMLRAPHTVEIQRIDTSGTRADLIALMSPVILGLGSKREASTLEVARFLMQAAIDLPDYAKQTKQVAKRTLSVRTALLHAKDPARLIYRQLPEALGMAPIDSGSSTDPKLAEDLIKSLRRALRELHGAYPRLLASIRTSIGKRFQAGSDEKHLREALTPRAGIALPEGANPTLRTFMERVRDASMPLDEWTESLATLLVGKPPKYWFDRDLDDLQVRIGHLAVDFSEMESLALAGAGDQSEGGTPLFRVSVRHSNGHELHRVLPQTAELSKPAESLRAALRKQLESKSFKASTDERITILANLCEELLSELQA